MASMESISLSLLFLFSEAEWGLLMWMPVVHSYLFLGGIICLFCFPFKILLFFYCFNISFCDVFLN